MEKFELTFLLQPDLDDDKVEEVSQRVREIIAKDGEAEETKLWGKRPLSYPIKKRDDAIYVFQPFASGPDVPAEITRFFSLNENVLRHLIVRAIPEPPVVEPRVVTKKTEVFIPAKAVKETETPAGSESAPDPAKVEKAEPESFTPPSKGVDEDPGEVEETTPSSPEATPEG